MQEKKLLLISTGGTISQNRDPLGIGQLVDKGAEALSEELRGTADRLEVAIVPKQIIDKDSSNIVPDDWNLMVDTIVENYESYDGFVITHGTNTLGYTSAALTFALGNLGKPVVLTGSQVPYGEPGSDAVLNLQNAIRVANEGERLVGVVAVFGSHIVTGVRVKKRTEFAYDAFTTFSSNGSIGRIGRELSWNVPLLTKHNAFMNPIARKKVQLDIRPTFDLNIVSLTEFPGLRSQVFRTLVEAGAKGFIYRAAGAGDPNVAPVGADFANLREGFEYLCKKEIPIVVTTQAAEGVASMDVNEPGRLASELGAIPAWDMSMEAMTVKLAWLLGRRFPYSEMKTSMLHSYRGEIDPTRS